MSDTSLSDTDRAEETARLHRWLIEDARL